MSKNSFLARYGHDDHLREIIREKRDSDTDYFMSTRKSIPEDVEKHLLKSKEWTTRLGLAENSSYPKHIDKLSNDKDLNVRLAVLRNPNSTSTHLENVRNSSFNKDNVDHHIAMHSNSSKEQLERTSSLYPMYGPIGDTARDRLIKGDHK